MNNFNALIKQQEKRELAYPGKFLGYTFDYSLGETGVYRKDDKIYASLLGEVEINTKYKPPQITVINNNLEYIPKINDEVYFKVTKVSKMTAYGDIVASVNKVIKIPISAIIKYESVKEDFKDFDLFDCFVPGDIVLCNIISIDLTNYICCSTKNQKYGVVLAKSMLTYNLMLPLNFENMICMNTQLVEKRKVAKPVLNF